MKRCTKNFMSYCNLKVGRLHPTTLKMSGFYGSSNKQWVLDQMSRILLGTPVRVVLAKWMDGTEEHRFWTEDPSEKYTEWVKECKNGEDGPETYGYDEGIAP